MSTSNPTHWLNQTPTPFDAACIFVFHEDKVLLQPSLSTNPIKMVEYSVPTVQCQGSSHSLRDQVLQYLTDSVLPPVTIKNLHFMKFAHPNPESIRHHDSSNQTPFVILRIDQRPEWLRITSSAQGTDFVWRTAAVCQPLQPSNVDELPQTHAYWLVTNATRRLRMYTKPEFQKCPRPFDHFCDDMLLSIIRARAISLLKVETYGGGNIYLSVRNNKLIVGLDMNMILGTKSRSVNVGTICGSWTDAGSLVWTQVMPWQDLMEEDGRLRVFWVDTGA